MLVVMIGWILPKKLIQAFIEVLFVLKWRMVIRACARNPWSGFKGMYCLASLSCSGEWLGNSASLFSYTAKWMWILTAVPVMSCIVYWKSSLGGFHFSRVGRGHHFSKDISFIWAVSFLEVHFYGLMRHHLFKVYSSHLEGIICLTLLILN